MAVLEPQSFAGTQKFYLNGTSLATKSSTTSSTLVMYPDVASNEAWVPLNLDGGDSSDGFFSVVNNTLQFRFKKNQKQSSPWMGKHGSRPTVSPATDFGHQRVTGLYHDHSSS